MATDWNVRYERFLKRIRDNPPSAGHLHHIVPRSLGGSNEESNLILLTPRQHFVAHWILWKLYGGKMTQAFWMMCHTSEGVPLNSRNYAKLSEEIATMNRANSMESARKSVDELRKDPTFKFRQVSNMVEGRRRQMESADGQRLKSQLASMNQSRSLEQVHSMKLRWQCPIYRAKMLKTAFKRKVA